MELLDLPVGLFISVEMDGMRRRVTRAAWPHCVHFVDVNDISEKIVRKWRETYPRILHLLCGGGFPCRDMSGLRGWSRAGVAGKQSGLVIHLPRIFDLIRMHWPEVTVWDFAENVASSLPHDVKQVSELLGCWPVDINSGDVSWVNRPRLLD